MNPSLIEQSRTSCCHQAPLDLFELLRRAEESLAPPTAVAPLLSEVRGLLGAELALLHAPGARQCLLRSTLVLLWAGDPDKADPSLTHLAAATEMVYHAMLAQRASLRHSSARDVFGILTNDLAMARALSIYAHQATLEEMRAISAASIALTEALLEEMQPRPDLPRLAGRVGRYLSACCEVGACAAGLPPDRREAAAEYGYRLVDALWAPERLNGHLPRLATAAPAAPYRDALTRLASEFAAGLRDCP